MATDNFVRELAELTPHTDRGALEGLVARIHAAGRAVGLQEGAAYRSVQHEGAPALDAGLVERLRTHADAIEQSDLTDDVARNMVARDIRALLAAAGGIGASAPAPAPVEGIPNALAALIEGLLRDLPQLHPLEARERLDGDMQRAYRLGRPVRYASCPDAAEALREEGRQQARREMEGRLAEADLEGCRRGRGALDVEINLLPDILLQDRDDGRGVTLVRRRGLWTAHFYGLSGEPLTSVRPALRSLIERAAKESRQDAARATATAQKLEDLVGAGA